MTPSLTSRISDNYNNSIATMAATETTMLPKLNDHHWRPHDSRVMTSDARARKNGKRSFHGAKPSPARKGSLPSSSSSKTNRYQDSNNNINNNNNKLIMEREKTIAFPLSSRSTAGTANAKRDSNNNISIRRFIAINGNIQEKDQRNKTASRVSQRVDGKVVIATPQKQQLGVNGVSLKTQKKSNDKNNNNKRKPTTNDLISPLLNAFQDEISGGDSSHYYKRLLNRNSFLSNHQQQQASPSKPKLVTRISLDETKSTFSKQSQRDGSATKYLTIGDYLRRENARYAQNELSVKKILFDNWLHNIQFVEFEDDKSSIAISISTSLPADPEALLMMDDEV